MSQPLGSTQLTNHLYLCSVSGRQQTLTAMKLHKQACVLGGQDVYQLSESSKQPQEIGITTTSHLLHKHSETPRC